MRSIAVPATTSKSVAVTVIGLSTLLLGGTYGAVGGWLIFAGADWFAHPSPYPWMQVIAFGGIVPGLMILLGGAFLLPALIGLLAGLGVLLRKRWGLILALILAVMSMLLGLLWVAGSSQEVSEIAVGVVQMLYGIVACVVLLTCRAEFSRPRLGANPMVSSSP